MKRHFHKYISFLIGHLLFIFYFASIVSCEKKEETFHQDNSALSPCHSSPGFLVKLDGFSATLDTTWMEYKYVYYCSSTNIYNLKDSTLSVFRCDSTSRYFKYIEFMGSNIVLGQTIYPAIFWPPLYANSKPFLKIKLTDTATYSVSPFDTSLFSITLINFINDTLHGTFGGTLYNVSNMNDSLTITNGRFDIRLSTFH